MLEISFNKVSKNYGEKVVLKNINIECKTNDHIALIGSNGCGKSTILKLIAKIENPSSGDVFIRKEASIGLLTQQPNPDWYPYTVKEIIQDSFPEINQLKEKLKKEEEKLGKLTGEELEKEVIKYSNLQEKMIEIGGYEVETKIDKIVAAFKAESLLERKYELLSGGEKTIVNLIIILLREPDILLLDEPNNHLDIDMIEWLESFLRNLKKTIIVVSHDRYFLDQVATKTILIDRGEAEIFHGNYSYYLEENERRITSEFNAYKTQQKQIEAMKKSIKKLREFGKLAYPCGENFFRRAASIEKRLEKIEVLEKPQESKTIPLKFQMNQRSGKDVIVADQYSLSIGEKELLKNTKFSIQYQERVCLMGKNGCGKSTLMKDIMRREGSIKVGSNVKIGYIPQDIRFEDETKTILEEARQYFIGTEEILRSALTKFLFYSEGIFVRLKDLSGGERLRLKLFCLMQQDNNVLLLDEPTNHIDINTKEVLEEALLKYSGTILMISHDRYFINKVATRILYFENQKLVNYIGNYNDLKATRARQKRN